MSDMFPRAVGLVLEREGGPLHTNHAWDNGGETKWGVTKRSYPHLDIAKLTKEQAVEIYRKDFWEATGCPDLPWWAALIVFDTAVNSGPTKAAKLFQETLGVSVDGKIGPKTKATATAVRDKLDKVCRFMAKRVEFLATLEDWKIAGEGWAYRTHVIAHHAME